MGLQEGYGASAFFGGMIVPFVAPDGDAVVACETLLPSGGDQLFSPAKQEVFQIYRSGQELLFFREVDVLSRVFHLVSGIKKSADCSALRGWLNSAFDCRSYN